MGTVFEVSCTCGFKSSVHVGAGQMNFETYCGAPAVCKPCGVFLELNYFIKDQKCPDCDEPVVFYDDSSLQAPVAEGQQGWLVEWHVEPTPFRLPWTTFYCPRCHQLALTFELGALFD